MPLLNLSEPDLQTIINALHAASGLYLEDAHRMDVQNQPRLAEQFREQAKKARELAQELE